MDGDGDGGNYVEDWNHRGERKEIRVSGKEGKKKKKKKRIGKIVWKLPLK